MDASDSSEPMSRTQLDNEELQWLATEIKDYQITHGSLLKLCYHESEHSVPSVPVGVALFPTPFPRACFEEACAVQTAFNALYVAIAEDHDWLEDVLRDLIKEDKLVSALWDIHLKVKQEGRSHDFVAGIFRSDYMLHQPTQQSEISIKQVEINTFSVAGGTHGTIVSNMHQNLHHTEAYSLISTPPLPNMHWPISNTTPANPTLASIISTLTRAHHAYRPLTHHKTCILMTVQPFNTNIADERPITTSLSASSIPTFRIQHGLQVLALTTLSADNTLLYTPNPRSITTYEVSVIYHRAGYDEAEYDPPGYESRLRLERSRAIPCPSVPAHLTSMKVVQTRLTLPGEVEKFLPPEGAARVRRTFMPQWSMATSEGRERAEMGRVGEYVLKPCKEGGGHNVFGEDIEKFMDREREEVVRGCVLMEMIRPPVVEGVLMSMRRFYAGDVVSELGVFGCVMWKCGKEGDEDGRNVDFVFNEQGGWSFKTKGRDVNEMSVVKGYGCFDSPMLVDELVTRNGS